MCLLFIYILFNRWLILWKHISIRLLYEFIITTAIWMDVYKIYTIAVENSIGEQISKIGGLTETNY